MSDIELIPRWLQVLDRIVREAPLPKEHFSHVERYALIPFLRAELVTMDDDGDRTIIEPTDKGRQLASEVDLDSRVTVEATL